MYIWLMNLTLIWNESSCFRYFSWQNGHLAFISFLLNLPRRTNCYEHLFHSRNTFVFVHTVTVQKLVLNFHQFLVQNRIKRMTQQEHCQILERISATGMLRRFNNLHVKSLFRYAKLILTTFSYKILLSWVFLFNFSTVSSIFIPNKFFCGNVG